MVKRSSIPQVKKPVNRAKLDRLVSYYTEQGLGEMLGIPPGSAKRYVRHMLRGTKGGQKYAAAVDTLWEDYRTGDAPSSRRKAPRRHKAPVFTDTGVWRSTGSVLDAMQAAIGQGFHVADTTIYPYQHRETLVVSDEMAFPKSRTGEAGFEVFDFFYVSLLLPFEGSYLVKKYRSSQLPPGKDVEEEDEDALQDAYEAEQRKLDAADRGHFDEHTVGWYAQRWPDIPGLETVKERLEELVADEGIRQGWINLRVTRVAYDGRRSFDQAAADAESICEETLTSIASSMPEADHHFLGVYAISGFDRTPKYQKKVERKRGQR